METSRAFVCTRLSADRSGLEVGLWPVRAPGPGEVRIRVRAAALNFPDLLMSQGSYQYKPDPPFVIGMEGAGEVEAVGPDVSGPQGTAGGAERGAQGGGRGAADATPAGQVLTLGQAVYFGCRDGAMAEHVVLPAQAVRPAPPGWSHAEAAAWRVGAITAWVGLSRRADLRRGETLLVHGASGGMGIAAVQLGRHLGATVIATGRSAARLQAARQAGAHHLIEIGADGFRERVKTLTDGRGADVVFDPVGGDVFEESARCIAWNGRLLVIGFASGRIGVVPSNIPLIKGFSIVGVRAGEYGRRDPVRGAEHQQAIEDLARAGVFRPHIGACFPLAEASAAMACLAAGQVPGKIVVEL